MEIAFEPLDQMEGKEGLHLLCSLKTIGKIERQRRLKTLPVAATVIQSPLQPPRHCVTAREDCRWGFLKKIDLERIIKNKKIYIFKIRFGNAT